MPSWGASVLPPIRLKHVVVITAYPVKTMFCCSAKHEIILLLFYYK